MNKIQDMLGCLSRNYAMSGTELYAEVKPEQGQYSYKK